MTVLAGIIYVLLILWPRLSKGGCIIVARHEWESERGPPWTRKDSALVLSAVQNLGVIEMKQCTVSALDQLR